MFARIASRRRPASWSRRAARLARQLTVESLEVRQMLAATPLTFQVVDDASANKSFRYSEVGAAQGSTSLVAANSAPRGVASTVAVEKSWVIDANRNVYVYHSATGSLLGSWSAGSMPNNATPEGIATDGTDVWIVDSRSDKVYRYAGAASRLTGSQAAASSFGGIGSNPKDFVTDGVHLWIVDDGNKSDQVYKFHVTNGYWGSWTIDKANKSPTGIALDPANVGDIWISDSGTDRVYKYAAATGLNNGTLTASSSFALASGNTNPQGLIVPGRPWAEAPYQVEWIRQLGTAAGDSGLGVSVDGFGSVYLSGGTSGSLSVPNPTGAGTSFLAEFDAAGSMNWLQQANPVPGVDHRGIRVAADSLGNVFQAVGGSSLNNYDAAGTLRWTTFLPSGESIFNVTSDDQGYAYMSSWEGNFVHVRKFDGPTGNIVWAQVLDTGGVTNSSGIAADHLGNVYVAAYTNGASLGTNAGGYDAVLAKYSDAGVLLWTRQFGTSEADYAFQVATDQFGNVYTNGRTTGSLGGPNAGDEDNFLTKHDAAGNLLWRQQWGASGQDLSSGSWVDPQGNVYRAMTTFGALGGAHLGDSDIVAVKYDASGNLLWATQLGASGAEVSTGGISGDDLGNIYIAGQTTGSWDGPNAGGTDAVLIKLTPPAAAASFASVAPLSSLDASLTSLQSVTASSTALAPQKVASAAATTPVANGLTKNRTAAPAREQVFAALATPRHFAPVHRAPFAGAASNHDDAALHDRSAGRRAAFDDALDAALASLL